GQRVFGSSDGLLREGGGAGNLSAVLDAIADSGALRARAGEEALHGSRAGAAAAAAGGGNDGERARLAAGRVEGRACELRARGNQRGSAYAVGLAVGHRDAQIHADR